MEIGSDPPAYGHAPFPNDAVRDGDHLGMIAGLDAMVGAKSDLIQAHLAALDGWGLRPAVEFFIDGDLDPASVPETTSAVTDPLVVVDVATQTPVPFDWLYDADRHVIVGSPHPGTQLAQATPYAAVVTRDVHASNGSALGAATLDKLAGAGAHWQSTADAYTALRSAIGKDRIAGIAVFTTQHATDVLLAARAVMADRTAVPAPVLAFANPGFIFDTAARLTALFGQATRDTTGPRMGLEQWGTDNPTGMAHDHIAVVGTGTITIARFRDLDHGTYLPNDGTFMLGSDGKPVVRAIEPIPVTFVLPKGTVPAAGFPIVIFGHGLGGSRTGMMNLAEPLTAQGYAVVAIDMWGHGSRYDPTDVQNNFRRGTNFMGDPNLHDGFGDDPGMAAELAFFESFMNFAAIRDSMRQSALDISRLADLLQSQPDLSALHAPYTSTPKIDPTRVYYLGESFGTIVGTTVSAIEPSISLYVFNVPGGGLADYIVPNSPSITGIAVPVMQGVYRPAATTVDRFNPLLTSIQAMFDAGDPFTYAPHVLKDRFPGIGARDVVCIEAMHDEIMPNASTAELSKLLGLSVLTPDITAPLGMPEVAGPVSANLDGQTAVLVQYEPATHGYDWSAQHGNVAYQPDCPCPGDPTFPKLPKSFAIQEPIYETMDQVIGILRDRTVRSTKAPVADFDGDGVPDAQDAAPWDPTMH